MATELNFVEYVRDQMQGAGQVTFRKMFGEYALYCECRHTMYMRTPVRLEQSFQFTPTSNGKAFALVKREGAVKRG